MVEESTVSASTRAMEGADEEAAHRGAGHGVARDAMRALRLSLAAGLLVLACVLGVALAVRGGGGGVGRARAGAGADAAAGVCVR